MKKINWKDGLISLGIIGTVVSGSAYLNYTQNQVDPATKAIHDRTEQDLSYMNAKAADINSDPLSDLNSYNDNTSDTSDNSAFVDDSNNQEQTKQEPKVGMYWQDIKNTSWGEPEDKTTTKDKYGTTELWIYSGGRSLLFEDGVLESITE